MRLNLRRNSLLAVFETLTTVGTLLLLYKLLIVHLSVQDLGVWSLVIASASIARFGDFGVSAGVNRFVAVADARDATEGLVRLIETSTVAVFALYIVLSAIFYGPAYWLLEFAVSGAQLTSARELLPLALASLVLVNGSGVVLSAITGVQRSYIKSTIVIAGNVVLLASAYLLLPICGLIGVAIAQCIQASFLFIAGWLTLTRAIGALPLVPRRFHWSELRPLVSYGWKVQLGSVAGFFFEPVTKMLMARYGGVGSLGVYEVALRLVMQSRNLITSVNQTLVSAYASINEHNPQRVRSLLTSSLILTALSTALVLSIVAACAPLASEMMLRHDSLDFRLFTYLLCIGWGLNTLTVPLYMMGLGLGEVRYNLASHLVTAAMSPLAAFLLGKLFGGVGVVSGAMIGLLAGTAVLVLGRNFTFRAIRDHRSLDVGCGESLEDRGLPSAP